MISYSYFCGSDPVCSSPSNIPLHKGPLSLLSSMMCSPVLHNTDHYNGKYWHISPPLLPGEHHRPEVASHLQRCMTVSGCSAASVSRSSQTCGDNGAPCLIYCCHITAPSATVEASVASSRHWQEHTSAIRNIGSCNHFICSCVQMINFSSLLIWV